MWGLCPWRTSKRSIRFSNVFNIFPSLYIVMWIQLDSLCRFKFRCIHTRNISSIACSSAAVIFFAVSGCNSGVWTKSGLWGRSYLSGLAHSDEVAEAWRAGADAVVMLFIEGRWGECLDIFWYLFVPLLCWFLHHDLSDGRRIAKSERIEDRQTCKLVQWAPAGHEGDCKWGYLWWDASTVDAGQR